MSRDLYATGAATIVSPNRGWVRVRPASGIPAIKLAAALLAITLFAATSVALAARAVTVNDSGQLHLLKSYGSVLVEQGPVSGTLPGQTKVRMVVGSTVTATFSIATRYGNVYGSGRATLHSSGRYASFGGSLSVSHGSGRYAHAHGTGKLYGVIERRSDAVTVQTEGRLAY